MKKYTRLFLLHALTSLIVSVIVVFVYENYSKNEDKLLNYNSLDLKKVAEAEWRLSEGYKRLFMSAAPDDFTRAAESTIKAVVGVRALNDNSFMNAPSGSHNSGSGVIINTLGYIITNYHIVEDNAKVDVTFYDNRRVQGDVVGVDRNTDLALIKVKEETLHFLDFGNSDSLRIGEWILAVGNPLGLRSSVTAGIISAKARNISLLEETGIESFIQTDAVVNPGNSGGAMVNTNGELVGICTAILSNSGRYEGYSFAIPSNIISKVVSDLMRFGAVQRGWLGIEIENTPQSSALSSKELVSGVVISAVIKNGGGFEAGLREADIITSVNEVKTSTVALFMEQMAKYSPGDVISVTYVRGGRQFTTRAGLRNQLNTTDLLVSGKEGIFKKLGIEVRDLAVYEKSVYPENGVIVVSVQNFSAASSVNMEPGYIITHAAQNRIVGVSSLQKILAENRGKEIVVEGFYPGFPGKYPYKIIIPVD